MFLQSFAFDYENYFKLCPKFQAIWEFEAKVRAGIKKKKIIIPSCVSNKSYDGLVNKVPIALILFLPLVLTWSFGLHMYASNFVFHINMHIWLLYTILCMWNFSSCIWVWKLKLILVEIADGKFRSMQHLYSFRVFFPPWRKWKWK